MPDPTATLLVCSTSNDHRSGVYSYVLRTRPPEVVHRATTPLEKPTFVAFHPNGAYCYVANRTGGGTVTALRRAADGTLTRLNDQSSGGKGPCYVSIDRTGTYAFVANYDAGTVASLRLATDGRLRGPCDVVSHDRVGRDPHPHAAVVGPEDRFVYVPDLGLDRVFVYRIEGSTGRLVPVDHLGVDLPQGAGPRHLAFDPDGRFAVVVNELDSTLTLLGYDPGSGGLTPLDTAGTLPDDVTVTNSPADVHVHPAGRWVYASNRGHDSIAQFRIEGAGTVTRLGHVGTGGRNPRDFVVDPTGRLLLVENRDSNEVGVFALDARRGTLSPTGVSVAVPRPTCAVISENR